MAKQPFLWAWDAAESISSRIRDRYGATDVPSTADLAVERRREQDVQDLLMYAAAHGAAGREYKRQAKEAGGKRKKPAELKQVRGRLASMLVRGPGTGETTAARMRRRAAELGVDIPSVVIKYKDLGVSADALIGSDALPTLSNTVTKTFKSVFGGSKTQEMKILKSVSGVLKPGRLTLLLGPPNAGKSTFLKILSGHHQAALRQEGSVTYNGVAPGAFVLERTAAYVDQEDNHIAQLTVGDTLQFSWTCQISDRDEETRLLKNMTQRALQAQRATQSSKHNTGTIQDTAQDTAHESAPDLTFLHTGEMPESGLSDAEFDMLLFAAAGVELKVDVILKLMGLWHTRDTVVGNALLRGVSGGERHRVTTAEMLVGPRPILMMDEISTGLDSATLFSIMQMLGDLTRSFQLTTLVALLQPPPEIVDLFDDIILLSDGVMLFHGPVSEAVPFLESCGFECPVFKDKSSFMQEVTAPIGQLHYATPELRERHKLPQVDELEDVFAGKALCPVKENIVSLEEMAARFWDSERGKALRAELDDTTTNTAAPRPRSASKDALSPDEGGSAVSVDPPDAAGHASSGRSSGNLRTHSGLVTRRYALGLPKMLSVVCRRQWQLAAGQRPMYIGRMIQIVVISLMIGSLWWDLAVNLSASRSYFAIIYMSMLFLCTGKFPELSQVTLTKAVFFKHRDNFFYAPGAYAMSLLSVSLPTSAIEVLVFSIIVYWMVGLTPSAGAFFIFLLLIFAVMAAFGAIVRLIGFGSPSPVVGNAVASLMLLLLIGFAGFTIPRSEIPGWWIWAYYLSPLSWGLQAIVINEMTQDRWQDTAPGFACPATADLECKTVGEAALDTFSFRSGRQWIWWGLLYQVGILLLSTVSSFWVLAHVKPARSPAIIADAEKQRRYEEEALARKLALQAKIEEGGGEQLSFEQVTITFVDLEYFVPNRIDSKEELQLLRGVTGTVAPGTLCALMGGSGAGKTTFMDVIAGRKTTGRIMGDIMINGHPVDQRAWSRNLGYVEQSDIHSPQLTVMESLLFSARLRLPRGTSEEAIQNQVSSTLQMVDLTDLMDAQVGYGRGSGLSTEQRKRLTIAVELVANPGACFLDEPTSGLDARAANVVIRAVKSVAESGRTVMVVVHQPSIDIFLAFDALLLFARGGRTVFFGPLGDHAKNLANYLSSYDGVSPMKPGYNPATWMLEVTGGSMTGNNAPIVVDFPDAYKSSELAKENRAVALAAIEDGKANHPPLSVKGKYAASFASQVKALSWKFRRIYWRKPDYNLVRFLITLVTSLVLSTTYLSAGQPEEPVDQAQIQSILGVLYISVSFIGMTNLMTALPVVAQERTVFYREKASSMYSSFPFALASGAVEVPYILAQVVIYTPLVFFLVDFSNEGGWRFWYFALMVALTICLYTFLGQTLAYCTGSQEVALTLASGLNFLFNIFNGFALPYNSMPTGWQWMNRIVPTTWVIYGLSVSQLGDSTKTMVLSNGDTTTVSAFMESVWDYEFGFKWWCPVIVLAWVILLRVASVFAVKYANFQSR